MRDVLVRLRDLSRWGDVGAYAADLAARINGTLTGVYVKPKNLPIATLGAGTDVAVAGRLGTTRTTRITESLATWATAMGVRQATWQIVEGDAARVLARMSVRHDLLVLDRDPQEPLASVSELGEIITSSRAPVLLVPPRRREATLHCIALAWNHTEESFAAIHAARPLLTHATKIVLLEGGRPDVNEASIPEFDLAQYMTWQGFRVERDTIRGESSEAGEMLIHAARRHRADLLVMGAYGRSRLREWALGGATRSVLFDASLPVFLKH